MDRFARQTVLPEVGVEGQQRLAGARVLVVGVGGLGCPAAQALAAAGVGHLTLVDPDVVEVSNLHRQVLYTPADAGRAKVDVAAERLTASAPELQVQVHIEHLGGANADALVAGHDIVLDGTDDVATRYVIDDACRTHSVPWVFAAVDRYEAQLALLGPDGPWYRDLWQAAPPPEKAAPPCAVAGVLGPAPAVLGAWQAHEALLWLLGVPRPRHLMLMDLRAMTVESITLGPPRATDELGVDDIDGHVVVDVRARGEPGTPIPGALHVPIGELADRAAGLPPRVVCVCATGARARHAVTLLRRRGVEAYALRGGAAALGRPVGGV